MAPLSLAKEAIVAYSIADIDPRRRVAAAVASTLPLLALFALAPLAFDPVAEVMSCAISMFVLLWLASLQGRRAASRAGAPGGEGVETPYSLRL